MFSKKIYEVVEASILSDRNLKEEDITEIKIAKNFIELTVEDKGDKIKIKRGTKENLKTYWNISMMNNYHTEKFINEHHITFTEFRTEFEKVLKDITGGLDLNACVTEALNNIADQKITSNGSRVERSDNAGKKAAEIHGENETEDIKDEFLTEEEIKETQGEKEQSEEEKKELILNLIVEKGEYKYKATEISEITGIDVSEITGITLNLIEENKILMQKKGKSGKNGIYGAILVPIIQA